MNVFKTNFGEMVILPHSEKLLKEEVLKRLSNRFMEKSKEYLEINNSVYTGEILKEIEVKKVKETMRVRYKSNHALWVEFGTKPASRPVPVAPLAEWANKKLGLSPKEAETFGVFLSRKITRYGIKPCPFIAPTIYYFKKRRGEVIWSDV